jgi:hypothetical protein
MVTTIYTLGNEPFLDARGATSSRPPVVMTGTLKLKLKGSATAEEIAALELGMLNATHERDHVGWVYANAMEKAWDIHGMDGLKMQIAYMLLYLGKWHGPQARDCKKVLRKFCK